MGLGFSSFISYSTGSSGPTLGGLPESCVASIIRYMDPPQICQLTTFNRAFNVASSTDFFGESKFASNYHLILNKIFDNFPIDLGKFDIYVPLCSLNDLDKGTKVS